MMEPENDTLTAEPVTDIGEIYDQLEQREEGAAAEPQAPATPGIEAPQHWPQEVRERFTQADPQWQQWLIERHKAMEGDYTRKAQEIAEYRRQYDAQVQAADHYRQIWSPLAQRYGYQNGLDEVGLARQAASYISSFYQDPKGFAKWVASQAGIELPQEEAEYVDPAVQRVQSELARTQQALQNVLATQQYGQQVFQQSQEQAFRQSIRSEIDAFKSTKDAKGNLAYPHFDNQEVQKRMAALMKGDPLTYDLKTAYDEATRLVPKPANPGARVAQARRAASGLNGSGVPLGQPKNREDYMRQLWDQLER